MLLLLSQLGSTGPHLWCGVGAAPPLDSDGEILCYWEGIPSLIFHPSTHHSSL